MVGLHPGRGKKRLQQEPNAGARGDHAVAVQERIIGHGAGNKPLRAEVAARRLKPHDPAGRGGNANRTAAIAGLGRAHEAAGYLDGRAARRSARGAAWIKGIIGVGKIHRLRIDAQAQLRGGGLANECGALLFQCRNERLADRGIVRALGIAQSGGHARDIVEILCRQDPPAQPAGAGRRVLQIQVGKTVLCGAHALHLCAQSFYGKVHGAPV